MGTTKRNVTLHLSLLTEHSVPPIEHSFRQCLDLSYLENLNMKPIIAIRVLGKAVFHSRKPQNSRISSYKRCL